MKSLKKLYSNYSFYLFMLIFFIIFSISTNMSFKSDEFNYSHITWTNIRLSSLSDIITSQKILYVNWTGRILAHFFIQLFLFLGHNLYPIFNSLIFCLFIYLIVKLSSKKTSSYLIISASCLVFLFIPIFGETIIWLSGSLNYLWPATLFLLFIYLYNKENSKLPIVMLLAFLSGMSQETIFLGGGAYLIYNLINKKFTLKTCLIYGCFFIGGLILLCAPGNFLRASSSQLSKFYIILDIIKIVLGVFLYTTLILINTYLKKRTLRFIENLSKKTYLNVLSILSVIALIAFYILGIYKASYSFAILNLINTFKYVIILIPLYLFIFIKSIQNNVSSSQILNSISLLLIGFVDALIMSVMPEFPYRSLFLSCTFIIIATMMLLPYIDLKQVKIISIPILISTISLLLITLNFYLSTLRTWNEDVCAKLESSTDSSLITLPIIDQPSNLISNFYSYSQFDISPYSVVNFYGARYYRHDKIIGIHYNHYLLRIKKDNLDKQSVYFEYTNSEGTKSISKCEDASNMQLADLSSGTNEAYYELPVSAEDVKLINNSNIYITDDDITTYTLN